MLVQRGLLGSLLRHLAESARIPQRSGRALIVGNGTYVTVSVSHDGTVLQGTLPCTGSLRVAVPLDQLRSFVESADSSDEGGDVEILPVEDGQVVIATEGRMTTLAAVCDDTALDVYQPTCTCPHRGATVHLTDGDVDRFVVVERGAQTCLQVFDGDDEPLVQALLSASERRQLVSLLGAITKQHKESDQ